MGLAPYVTFSFVLLQNEMNGRWTLGPRVCDLWTTSDVFCCTASILNIVVIAVDRYWLITRNVRYTHSATLPRRRVCAALLVSAWIIAALIAGSPLLGWRTGNEHDDPTMCMISQDPGYTIVSTFGAFWLPLGVILIVYARIFAFARRRTAARRSAIDGSTEAAGGTTARSSAATGGRCGGQRCGGASRCGNGKSPLPSIGRVVAADCRSDYVVAPDDDDFENNGGGNGLSLGLSSSGGVVIVDSVMADPTPSMRRTATPSSLTATGNGWNTLSLPSSSFVNDQSFVSYSLTPQESCVGRTATSADGDDVGDDPAAAIGTVPDTPGNGSGGMDLSVYVVATTSTVGVGNAVASCGVAAAAAVAADRRRKRRRAQLVRRSARTLGLIIGGFVVCWLPFFIVATATPFCSALSESSSSTVTTTTTTTASPPPSSWCRVPPTVSSVVLWLGYSNSLLNPAIYAIWDRSFRRSFQRLITACLCCFSGGCTNGCAECCDCCCCCCCCCE
jgi:hypothetical protein